jgi:hypothetical protein
MLAKKSPGNAGVFLLDTVAQWPAGADIPPLYRDQSGWTVT